MEIMQYSEALIKRAQKEKIMSISKDMNISEALILEEAIRIGLEQIENKGYEVVGYKRIPTWGGDEVYLNLRELRYTERGGDHYKNWKMLLNRIKEARL